VRLIDGLNTAQRVVIVVAIGIALVAIGIYVTNRGSTSPGLHYISTSLIGPGMGPPCWLRLIIWLVLDGIWAVASIVVLRPPQGSEGPP
jgi:hypothetical protein